MTDWQHHTGPLLIALGLYLGIGLATYPENAYTYASTISVNSTYEVEVENMTSEEFDRLKDEESKANDQANQILNSIQTLEGLDIYSNECGYAVEINPYKVIDCYYKNQDRIENVDNSTGGQTYK
jgi:hypothetical protein